MNESVSIIIPFFNCKYICCAIESALSQTYPHIEIIVIDDGSTKYTELLYPYKHYIKYVYKENGGTASALNYGIMHATGNYIAWLSSDDLFYPNKIDHQLHAMIDNKSMISYTDFHLIDQHTKITKKYVGGFFTTPVDFLRSFINFNIINGCTVMMKKSLFAKVGVFNESFKYVQDLDFWFRVMLAGVPFLDVYEPLTLYRVHDEMGTLCCNDIINEELKVVKLNYRGPLSQKIMLDGTEGCLTRNEHTKTSSVLSSSS